MMNREETLKYVQSRTKNNNLVKHMLAVEAEMRGLAKHFGEDEELWGLTGLVHDADYEEMKEKHPSEEFFKQLEELKFEKPVIEAVKAHGWKFQPGLPEPKTKMEWSLYCCDELSGLIIACALVRPSKKLAEVTLESIKKKWPQKSFAAGVNRSQTELCEEKLGIKLDEFIKICLQAIQSISADLGL
ncbi:MAG: HD domain-containing protein [Patescibacteria group bacterium]